MKKVIVKLFCFLLYGGLLFYFFILIITQTNERLLGTNNCFLYDVIPSFDKLIFINRALFTITAMLSRNRINLLKINKNSMTQLIPFHAYLPVTYADHLLQSNNEYKYLKKKGIQDIYLKRKQKKPAFSTIWLMEIVKIQLEQLHRK